MSMQKICLKSSYNGSMQNGTVHEMKMLAAIKNRLYLCSAFGEQVCELEY